MNKDDPSIKETYYRIMKEVGHWKPYRLEPMYDEHPELGYYASRIGVCAPQIGDYLVVTNKQNRLPEISVMSVKEELENVHFGEMPTIKELEETGTILKISEPQYIEDDIIHQREIGRIEEKIEECEHEISSIECAIADWEALPKEQQAIPEEKAWRESLEKSLYTSKNELTNLNKQLRPLTEKYQEYTHALEQKFGKNIRETAEPLVEKKVSVSERLKNIREELSGNNGKDKCEKRQHNISFER